MVVHTCNPCTQEGNRDRRNKTSRSAPVTQQAQSQRGIQEALSQERASVCVRPQLHPQGDTLRHRSRLSAAVNNPHACHSTSKPTLSFRASGPKCPLCCHPINPAAPPFLSFWSLMLHYGGGSSADPVCLAAFLDLCLALSPSITNTIHGTLVSARLLPRTDLLYPGWSPRCGSSTRDSQPVLAKRASRETAGGGPQKQTVSLTYSGKICDPIFQTE